MPKLWEILWCVIIRRGKFRPSVRPFGVAGVEEKEEGREKKDRKDFFGGKLLVVPDWVGVFTPADKLVRRGKEKKMELLHKHSRFPHIFGF